MTTRIGPTPLTRELCSPPRDEQLVQEPPWPRGDRFAWRLVDYWAMARDADLSEFRLEGAALPEVRPRG